MSRQTDIDRLWNEAKSVAAYAAIRLNKRTSCKDID
jgi:hypothetical protein